MSLHDELKNLREVARRLNVAKFDFEMPALKKFVDGLETLDDLKPPEDFLRELLTKFLRGEENFSRREIRSLPFIIFEPAITLDGVKKIMSALNFFQRSHMRAAVSVYLLNYDSSAKTELLRRKLFSFMANTSDKRKAENLFGEERFANMTKLFAQRQSVLDVLKVLDLSNFYRASNFIHVALRKFFRTENLSAQIKIIAELDDDHAAYENIFDDIADALIPTVDAQNFGREICLDIFLRRLGDPRFGLGNFNWLNVSPKSKKIFIHWLAKDDLETFFKIVAETSDDKQWRYREKFWRELLPRISNTWIFLARNAKLYAAKSNLRYGILTNGGGNQAVFVFQIGRYIFSEWSNVGKVRAYTLEQAKNLFGRREVSGEFLRKNFFAEWIHSSPQTDFWQEKVGAWINRHC